MLHTIHCGNFCKRLLVVWCVHFTAMGFLAFSLLLTVHVRAQDTTYIQWDPPRQMSFDQYNSVAPQIVAVGDTVHLMWTTTNGPKAFYARSTDAGGSWSVPLVLDDTTATVGSLNLTQFSSSGRFAYLFWTRCPPPCTAQQGRYVVDLRRSTDSGENWMARITIADDGNNTGNYSDYSAARDTVVGLINTRTPLFLSQRFGWSWDTGLQWNFYDANTRTEDRFVILSNGIHLLRRQTGVGLPRAEVSYLYSSDFGQTWTPYTFLSNPDSILSDEPDIAGNDDANLWAVWRDFKYGGFDGGSILLRRSTNYGLTWLNEQLLTARPSGIFPQVSNDGPYVAVTWDDTSGYVALCLSSDYGNSFQPIFFVGSGGDNVVALANSRVHVAWFYSSGGNGEIFYRRGRIVTTSVVENGVLPRSFSLAQNYPNPFNSETVIRFELPERSTVKLKLFDLLGSEVQTLVDETREAGHHQVRFDAKLLSSGMYFYKLQTSKFFAVKKCLLLK